MTSPPRGDRIRARPIGPKKKKRFTKPWRTQKIFVPTSLGLDGWNLTVYYDPTRIARDEVTRIISQLAPNHTTFTQIALRYCSLPVVAAAG